MPSFESRFLKAFRQTEGCWEWQKGTDPDGYGHIKKEGKTLRAHRASWEHFNGPIPTGVIVCHSCDNPSCVNPKHLWLGTTLDNQTDKIKKRRHANQIKTHCKNGHLLAGTNLLKAQLARGKRNCVECHNQRMREAYGKA